MSINISAIVVNKSGPYYVGDTLGFNKECHDGTNRSTSKWDFGDGTIVSYPDDANRGWQYHTYNLAGTYKVQYVHGVPIVTPTCAPWTVYTETKFITIEPKRAITFSPALPKEDQQVYFQALNFITSSVLWNFGDGTQLWGGHYQTYRYQNTGV